MTEQERLQEIEEIKQWLKNNDYKVIKWVLGEYNLDLEPFDEYIIERQIKKARLKEIGG